MSTVSMTIYFGPINNFEKNNLLIIASSDNIFIINKIVIANEPTPALSIPLTLELCLLKTTQKMLFSTVILRMRWITIFLKRIHCIILINYMKNEFQFSLEPVTSLAFY